MSGDGGGHDDPESAPGLYVHIPFCLSRCGYCAFVSSLYDAETADAYIAALGREIAERNIREKKFATLFIGGGTPSSLSPAQLSRLFSLLPPVYGEATCELNPDSASAETLRLLRDNGINRISFGVQTFSPAGLQLLRRRHTAEQALRAVELAAGIGFARGISIDLIHGWPGQEISDIRRDIEISVKLQIHHLSNYSLILEPSAQGYADYAARLPEDDEAEERSWQFIEETLEKNGFIHYETSNFSRPCFVCAHNVAVWRGGEYFGVGAGAHSHIDGRRFANCDGIEKYIRCSAVVEEREIFSERLEGEEKARECAVFWLRLFDGIELEAFRRKTGYAVEELYCRELPGLLREGVMEREGGRIRVSRRFQPVLDAVLTDLV